MLNFDRLHRWNAWLCPPLGFLSNLCLIWLVWHKTPKEMRVHSRILLQTCTIDMLLLAIIAIGQPVLALQPDFTFVILFHGYLVPASAPPLFLVSLFALWYLLHTLDMTGASVQFLYRFLVLNCRIRIRLGHYVAMLVLLFLPVLSLIILWSLNVFPSMNVRPYDADYFANFMDPDSANTAIHVTFVMDVNSAVYKAWDNLFTVIQAIAYGMVLFCGIRMVRFVYTNTFNHRLKELNKQLSKNLIILATFPLLLLSINAIFRLSQSFFDTNTTTALALLQGSICHWLPVLNPLTSIFTIRPYRDCLFRRKAKVKPNQQQQMTLEMVVQQGQQKQIANLAG